MWSGLSCLSALFDFAIGAVTAKVHSMNHANSAKKPNVEKSKTATVFLPPGGEHDETHAKKRPTCFRRFWDKNPRHSKTISDEKCHLYIVERPFLWSCNGSGSLARVTLPLLRGLTALGL